jgi:CBS domain containing-hemolysin-like protein
VTGELLLNIAVVIALILIEGICVAAELSLVSLRDGRAQAMASDDRRARRSPG